MNIASVPIIVTLVLGIIQILKGIAGNNEKFLHSIPVLAAVLGAILGLIAFYIIPDLIPATNVFYAIIIGGFSGLTSVGCHQIVKQKADEAEEKAQEKIENEEDKK